MRSSRRPGPKRRRRQFSLALLGAVLLFVLLAYVLRSRGPYDLLGNRSEFTDTACVAYGSTGHDRHTTVFIDSGHGGPDPGASGTAPDGTVLQEKRLTLAVALDALPLLRADGYRVAMSRIDDSPVARLTSGSLTGGVYSIQGEHADVAARVDCANAARAQLLLSIHFDSYQDPSVGGVETLYDADRPFSDRNLRFAQIVQQSIIAGLASHGWTVPDRGVQVDTVAGTPALSSQGASYGHLLILGPAKPGWFDHPSQMPGALSEPLFLTDGGEAAVAESRSGQQALALAFVAAINQYFQSGT